VKEHHAGHCDELKRGIVGLSNGQYKNGSYIKQGLTLQFYTFSLGAVESGIVPALKASELRTTPRGLCMAQILMLWMVKCQSKYKAHEITYSQEQEMIWHCDEILHGHEAVMESQKSRFRYLKYYEQLKERRTVTHPFQRTHWAGLGTPSRESHQRRSPSLELGSSSSWEPYSIWDREFSRRLIIQQSSYKYGISCL
jgi:hypothetical protein